MHLQRELSPRERNALPVGLKTKQMKWYVLVTIIGPSPDSQSVQKLLTLLLHVFSQTDVSDAVDALGIWC